MKHSVVLILFAAACTAPAFPSPYPEEGAVAPQAGSKPGAKAGTKGGDGGGTSGGKAQAAVGNVILNEVSCRGDEFVEVVNRGTTRVDLSGFSVADSDDPALAIPLFGMLNAGAHAAFPLNGLACDDDEAVLFDRGAIVDRIRAPLLPANASFARIPDARGAFVLAGPTPRTDNASFIDDAARLFVALDEPVPMTLPKIRITLDATAEASLRGVTVESPRPWLEATLTFEDAQGSVGPISTGLRLKGQSVFRDITGKAAFKLDFDRFKAGNHLLGIEKLTLNNFVQDATATRERVFYGLLERQGLAGPRVGYVEVLVNGRPFGVYLALESSDEAGFLGRSFPSSALLYEGEYGADLYVGKEANFDEDYGDDPTREALAHVIEDFSAAGNASLVEDTQDTIAWDRVIPQMAADIFCGHFDSYTANSNNFTFHIDDEGRLSIVSGGADQAFAQVVELDVNGGLLLERCLRAPGCTRSLNTAFSTLSGEVDEWLADGGAARLRADAVRLATFFAADERTDWDQRQLAGLVDELIAFVQSQVRAF